MTPPLIVTGHGRSGTHWVANVLAPFVPAAHEPSDDTGLDIVVDCRLWRQRARLEAEGHRIVHLMRDGRDVVRSAHRFWNGTPRFEDLCRAWSEVIDECDGLPTVRLEDLVRRQDPSDGFFMAHWREWPEAMTETFWTLCGEQMRRHGYERD